MFIPQNSLSKLKWVEAGDSREALGPASLATVGDSVSNNIEGEARPLRLFYDLHMYTYIPSMWPHSHTQIRINTQIYKQIRVQIPRNPIQLLQNTLCRYTR